MGIGRSLTGFLYAGSASILVVLIMPTYFPQTWQNTAASIFGNYVQSPIFQVYLLDIGCIVRVRVVVDVNPDRVRVAALSATAYFLRA